MPSPVELVRAIVISLVDQPDQVSAELDAQGVVALRVAPSDRGKVIGRQGRTIKALRSLATAAFGTEEKPVGVELVEK